MPHSLVRYREMRDFSITPEPRGRAATASRRSKRASVEGPIFVVQKHAATRLHYDLRLEVGGVLASWAVPKGPSMRVGERRLAMHTEDHPLEYAEFEGDIPHGQYGAGHMEIWDRGRWTPLRDAERGLAEGRLEFELHGERLRGRFALIRMHPSDDGKRERWLLIRERDAESAAKPVRQRAKRDATPRTSAKRAEKGERVEVAGVAISNAQRPVPGEDVTKLDLVRYYEAVADLMLPDLGERPLSLVRCPGGDFAHCFFRRHADDGPGGEDASGIPFVRVRTLQELVASVQGGTIEFHSWGSSAPRIDRPDRITLDLDPDPALAWSTFREACHLTRELLDRLELAWFVKTTGGKGLHFVVPIARRHDWDEVKDVAHRIAERLVATAPALFTANMSKAKRTDRVFVDYLRNAAGASAIASYSLRARKGLPVSMPIAWDALAEDVRGDRFNLRNVPQLLAGRRSDPWADYASTRQSISRARRML